MTISRSGAGGKFVTNWRKQRLAATPYDLPPPPPSLSPLPNRTNWFTGLIIPSACALASCAGKIVSSIISESESSSSEDEDFVSEDDKDNEYEHPNDGVNASRENNVTASEMMQYRRESQLGVQRTEIKHMIKQLIMQETFSREECDKFVRVLNSRVIDRPTEAARKTLLAGSPGKTVDHEDADVYNKAVLQAKKWFEDKKVGSSSRTKLSQQSCDTNSTGLEHVQNDGGSPVDVARSYMKERPPWASPTKNIELKTPSTATMKLFKENSVGHDSLSLSMVNFLNKRAFHSASKRNSFAAGSWNIHEELRRLHSKATDDMLHSPPSKIDPLCFGVAPSPHDSAGAGKSVSVVGERLSGHESSKNNKQIDALVDAGVSSDPALAALESRQDGKPSEMPSSKPATFVSGNHEVSEAVQMDECVAESKFSHPSSPTHAKERHNAVYLLPEIQRWAEGIDQESNEAERGTKSKQERELKRLEFLISYERRRKKG